MNFIKLCDDCKNPVIWDCNLWNPLVLNFFDLILYLWSTIVLYETRILPSVQRRWETMYWSWHKTTSIHGNVSCKMFQVRKTTSALIVFYFFKKQFYTHLLWLKHEQTISVVFLLSHTNLCMKMLGYHTWFLNIWISWCSRGDLLVWWTFVNKDGI